MIPAPYDYLNKEPGPKHLLEAIKLYGTKEIAGQPSNPAILQWAKECGLSNVYTNDGIAWCGLFMSVTLYRAGKQLLKGYDALRAKSWATYGVEVKHAGLSDILVFSRLGGGHVGYYVGEDNLAYHVLGGNQSDTVKIVRILKSRCMAIRRVDYESQPNNIRKIILSNKGDLSINEA